MLNEVLLSTIVEWPTEYVEKLKSLWIYSAEQIIGICSTKDGLSYLVSFLNTNEEQIKHLIISTRKHIPPERLTELDKPNDTSQFGLGANKPTDKPP